MRHAYRMLLYLYPSSYRELFRREMGGVFDQAESDYRSRGPLFRILFLCAEFAGLMAGAFSEWTYGKARRSGAGRMRSLSFVIPLVGLAMAALFQVSVYRGLASRLSAPAPDESAESTQLMGVLLFSGISVFVLFLVFAWNSRAIGNRAARLRRPWIPSGPIARTARRDDAR